MLECYGITLQGGTLDIQMTRKALLHPGARPPDPLTGRLKRSAADTDANIGRTRRKRSASDGQGREAARQGWDADMQRVGRGDDGVSMMDAGMLDHLAGNDYGDNADSPFDHDIPLLWPEEDTGARTSTPPPLAKLHKHHIGAPFLFLFSISFPLSLFPSLSEASTMGTPFSHPLLFHHISSASIRQLSVL